jgi:hypothetical protein
MKPKAKTKITGKEAIRQVLADGKPQKAKAICVAAAALVTEMKGKTPVASLSALLAVEAKKADGFVIRTAPGTFKLRAAPRPPAAKTTETG